MMITLAVLSFSLLAQDFEVIQRETREVQKEVHQERINVIAQYYDNALVPLKEKEAAEKETALQKLEYFLKDHPDTAKKSTILLSIADLYFDVDLPKSILFCQRFIQENPNSNRVDAAYYLLGVSYLYHEQTEQAAKTFQEFLNHFSKSAYLEEVRFRLAEIYFEKKEYETASLYFKQILENPQTPFYTKALYKLAWVNYLQNRYSEAINLFVRLLDMDSSASDILKQEAARYVAVSLFDGHASFPKIVSRDWVRAVWIHLGNLLAKADKNEEAAKALQEAIALDPKNPKNQELDLRVLDLTSSPAVKKSLIVQYINNSDAREAVQRALLDLSLVIHTEAKKTQDVKLFKDSMEDYALFINHFPEDNTLDQVLFYYSESAFDAKLFHYASIGFEQVRDWPWETEYREKAAVNAVYAYAEELKHDFPDYNLSTVDLAHKARFQGKVAPVMLGYIQSVDVLREKFPVAPDVPSLLFQTAGIYYSYGELPEAQKRFEQLIKEYPKHEAARVAAYLLVGDSVASEQWLMAAEQAKRYQDISPDFADIEKHARFKYTNKLFADAKTPEEFKHSADLYLEILNGNTKIDYGDKILFNAAMAMDRSGQYNEAENLFQKLYAAYPHSPLAENAKQQRAVYFEHRLQFEKAATIYSTLPGDKVTLLKAALDFEAAQKFTMAASLFERFIRAYPDSAEISDAYMRTAKAYQRARDTSNQRRVLLDFERRYKNKVAKADYFSLEPALANYRALKINSKSAKEQARQLIQKTQKLAELQGSYEQIVKNYELSAWTLASIYQIANLYEDLFQALHGAPCPRGETNCDEYASLLEDKAIVLEKKALDAYQLAIDRSSKVAGGSEWVLKAKSALYRMRPTEYPPAEALLEEPVIGLNYTYALLNDSDAEYQLLRGKLNEAEVSARSRLESNPFDALARLQMARIFYAKGQLEAAELTLEDSLEKDEKSDLAHLWLGHVYRAQGEHNKAIGAYEKSNLPEAFDNLGLLYLEQGDLEKAYLNLQKAADALPNFAQIELHLANYYFMAKDYKKAQAFYESALKHSPNLTAAQLNMGLLAMADQRYEAAQSAFTSFLEEAKPDSALHNRVQSYLKLVNQKIQLEKQRHEKNT